MKSGLIKLWLVVITVVVVVVALGVATLLLGSKRINIASDQPTEAGSTAGLTDAQKRFRQDWQRKCEGSGPVTLTHLPMRPEDFSTFIPYGLLAGAHVSPIDHVYFAPKSYDSPRDAYPVFMMADGYLIDIGRRSQSTDTGESKAEEFRLTFQHTCTFYTYFDLVTGLSDEVYAAFPDLRKKDYVSGHMEVKAGQQIGSIGGQTLDTAVYNFETRLTGFITPELYDGEGWKIYTDDFIKYFNAEHQELINSRNSRVAEPRSGKIDYDIDGKLIGNWFKERTKGYVATDNSDRSYYWEGHLAIVPDLYDPSAFWVSIGNWQGKAAQYAAKGNKPDPATIGIESGPIKYELAPNMYFGPGGQPWDKMTPISPVTMGTNDFVAGVALFQLVEPRKLKAEFFPGKTAAQVTGFTDKAWLYYR